METVDVIIVGAGLTGLVLARHLTQQNKTFLILEARDRIGGRIHTVTTESGAKIEMGATWFFPPFRNLFKMLKELKVELTEQYLKGYTMYESDKDSPARKSYSSGEDDMFRIKGGTSKLVETLYNSLDQTKILLGVKVSEINVRSNGVEVVGNEKIYNCKRVVTTIPPQLLAHSVSFFPALSDGVLGLMKETHTWMGDSIKAGVTYPKAFWKDEGLSGALYSNCGPMVQMYDQTNSEGPNAALVGFVNDRLSSLTMEERKDDILEQLARVFGDRAMEYLEYRETVWSDERLTMGEESNKPVRRVGRHNNNGHHMYQQPMLGGRVIIGGTETAQQAGGYMEGAVNSAKHIATLLRNPI